MRAAVAVWAASLFAAAATAQTASDVPAGDARIDGRVLHEEREAAAADVRVILYSLSATGEPGLRETRADESGAFSFQGIASDPEMIYLVGTRVDGVPFGARVVFAAGETAREVEIRVSDPSRAADDIRLLEPQLRLERGCTHLRVRHLHPLRNDSGRVVFVPPEARDGATPLFELLLPEDATLVEPILPMASDGFEREGRRLRYWGPVYPGSAGLEFGYGVPLAAESTLRIGFPAGSEPFRVLAPIEGARVTGAGLHREGQRMLQGGAVQSLRGDAIAAGGELLLQISLDDTQQTSAIVIDEARMWLGLDDAALDVSEQFQLRVSGDTALVANDDAPLLCIDLPEGAEALRFSNASLEMGLSRDPGGALALHGPIPTGESSVSLRYRLPVPDEPALFERRFAWDVSLLTVLVADSGLIPETDRLHRRRPIRSEDRSYLHIEGFGIEAGETVSLRLRHVPPRQSLGALASSGLVFGLALVSLVFLIGPLRSSAELPEATPIQAVSTARQAIYEALGALDEDFETGKLSEGDHARMRSELRAQAVALLRAERATTSPPSAEVKLACSSCGAEAKASDRFCSQCGAGLEVTEPPAS